MTYQKLLQSKEFLSCSKQFQQIFNGQPVYKSPKNYHDWNAHLIASFTAYCSSRAEDPTWLNKYSKNFTSLEKKDSMLSIATFLEIYFFNKTPALYLQRNLVEAIFKTNLPLIPPDLQIPFNSVVLMFPKDSPKIHDVTIKRIMVIYGRKSEPNCFCKTDLEDLPDAAFLCSCIIVLSNGSATHVSGSTDSNGKFKIDNAENATVFSDIFVGKIKQAAFKFALNAVLLSQYQPELLTTDLPVASSGTGFGGWRPSENKILPIRWLGKNYKRSTEFSSGTNSHASPQAHWRRGHWHHFRYGEKRKLLKLKWIQPVFVNAAL